MAKVVQRRSVAAVPTLDLEEVRPALIRLGERQVRSLRALAARPFEEAVPEAFDVLATYLDVAEVARVRAATAKLLGDLRIRRRD